MSTVDIDELYIFMDTIILDNKSRIRYRQLFDKVLKAQTTHLKAELLAKMPKRAYPQEINKPNGEPPSVTIDRCDAYNECLDEITKLIEEL